ncbi:MAG: esterase-like activity of phytase family protein [Polymorphobacter sp.]|uniref:esterase-like activity of phytase family protein n=1 Tax=Polymorphobacter sp. TaxID=1909290 RepID=UPI003A8A2B7D
MYLARLFTARTLIAGLALLLLLPYGLGAASGRQSLAVDRPASIVVTTTPLPLNRDDPGQTRIGALDYRGGLLLRSTAKGFGGVSGLASDGAGQFLAVTDTGNWFAFRTRERGGRLVGLGEAALAPILGLDGQSAPTKSDGDAEALHWDAASGAASIVYEQDHRIVHVKGLTPDRLDAPATREERWAGMADWRSNGGGESLAHVPLADGRTARLIIAEDAVTDDGHNLALLEIDGTVRRIRIPAIAEHRPTDAEWLDGTRLLLLHRRFNQKGPGAALTLVDLAPALAGDTPAASTTLAAWEAPVVLDNMEGITITRVGGETFVYLISDDNLNSLQQTVLLKFALLLPE